MNWDYSTDFLVVGSGGGGMAAALTAAAQQLSTLVVEKSGYFGGTTAISGGVIWIPNNHLMRRYGIVDSEADGIEYLQALTQGEVDNSRIDTFVKTAPEMLRFLEDTSLVKFESAQDYADYYPNLPGSKPGGRSLDPVPYSRRKLGLIAAHLRPPTHGQVLRRFSLTAKEAHAFLNFNAKTYWVLAKRMLSFYLDIPNRLNKQPDNRLTLGAALVGRLRKSLDQRNIPLWLNTAATSLITDQGKVIGVELERDGKHLRIGVNKGVLLASGGFAHNDAMRRKYHQIGAGWSVANPANTGDWLQMADQVGARLAGMSNAWWTPTMMLPGGRAEALIIGKSMPGCMMVNKKGKRFTNDAGPYEDVVKGQYAAHSEDSPAIPCYFIFDARFRHNYSLGAAIAPAKVIPDERLPRNLFESGWLKKADSIEQLAEMAGIDQQGLKETVVRYNGFALTGKDLDFGRGESISDRYYSDATVKPNPCLAPINQAPFYAIELYPGDLGTKGGLDCDANARVLNQAGEPIPGLYATGNCSASVMGNSYPGAGSTIGPSMTFGYIAAMHAAGKR